ncbi:MULTISPECIES: tyrosine-type recombinase/integrase [Enterobacteriaceae]|jgi:integrase|uniref:tyrosine-type recombinase/integrase n=1 Tax=Enterobacteriaceae TaxID=543 RepID=UPI00070CEC64|nr:MULTISPECIES: integrase arm-type DNA-binding domain-containing protein [Enterobacteriaceae]GJK55137.1 integrase [Enterobacter cloacae]HCD6955034.1 tyrosine-type recombinase/integrase [Klebsiella variicola]HCT5556218.1 tyrosine-type recombinase/integrase [Enterobacter hormaechei]EJC8212926.1 tyrosine-type recombinase/integrase [Citrobacter freundii]KUH11150.1 integrase [Escherichia coli]
MALTEVKVRNAKPTEKPVKLTDGDGMHLLVHPTGSKYWRLQYRFSGKQKMLALGVYPEVSLAEARRRREEARQLIAKNVDPGEKRKKEKIEEKGLLIFETVARDWHSSNRTWSDSHRTTVLNSLITHVFPVIGKRNITELKTRDLLVPLKKAEETGHLELAARLQQRITAIMRYAVHNALIDQNPAYDLAGAVTTAKSNHRPALPLEQLPELLKRIDAYKGKGITQIAVQLTLLTFIRSSELRFARWSEVNFKNYLWTIPAERQELEGVKYSNRGSKMKTPHLVPLSKQAVVLFKRLQVISGEKDLMFIGFSRDDKPISENTVNKALRTMGYDTKAEVCGHGFRTMACSALIESGLWSRDAVERQMSHQERNSVRAAYIHKAEHLEERKLMLQWWADYLDANRKEHITPFEFAQRIKKMN